MKDIFCVKCGQVTPHEGVRSGEDALFTCTCGHFVKFPLTESKKELEAMIEEHEAINRPLAEEKAKQDEQDKQFAELLK